MKGLGCTITTIKIVETRGKNFVPKNDRDVGMKKAQKQNVIQNGAIFGILYTHPYIPHSIFIVRLWLAGGM